MREEKKRRSRRRGQGLTEYVIVIGLVAIAMIGAMKGLQSILERTYGKVTNKLEDVAVDIEVGSATPDAAGLPPHLRSALADRACKHENRKLIDPATRICKKCKRQT